MYFNELNRQFFYHFLFSSFSYTEKEPQIPRLEHRPKSNTKMIIETVRAVVINCTFVSFS